MKNYILRIFGLFLAAFSIALADEVKFGIATLDNPAPGYIFTGNSNSDALTFYDNYGEAAYTKHIDWIGAGYMNYQIFGNKLTFFNTTAFTWYVVNPNLEIIDSIHVTSQYTTDFHDFKILPNGNYLLIANERKTVDMSVLINGGKKNATVNNMIIQEFNTSKQLVFQWSAYDHFNILDATEDIDLTQSVIDPFHLNAFYVDNDGNLLLSSRHLDEITKINRTNGQIIWRLGGSKCKNNQFTFTNDTDSNLFVGFTHQHDIQKLSNGNLVLFDNGVLRDHQVSRVVEYKLNENTLTATKVFEYTHNPEIFSDAMGNIQRLPNGNTFIGWGGVDGSNNTVIATEIDSMKNIVFEMKNNSSGDYRALRYVFKENAVTLDINSSGLFNFNDANNQTNVKLDLTSFNGSGKVSVEKHDYSARYINFKGTTACVTLPYRWVIYNHGITNIAGKIKIDLSNFQIDNKESLSIFRRNKESESDSFSVLTTTYNANTKTLEANIDAFGEFILGSSAIHLPSFFQPADNSFGEILTPVLTWNTIDTTATYQLQLATDINFSNVILDSNSINSNQIKLVGLNNYSVYYWHLKEFNKFCESDWTNPISFSTMVAAPTLIFPTNLSKDIQFDGNLKWTSVNGGESYHIQMSETDDFKNIILEQTLSGVEEINYKKLKSWKTYYWRVCSSNRGIWGNWSDTWSFTTMLSPVILSVPTNTESGIPVSGRLLWEQLSQATIYSIQIAKDTNFYNLDTVSTGVNTNYFDYTGLNNSTIYYWRVKGGNSNVKGTWSQVWSFKTMIATPLLQLPNNNAINISPNASLIWKPMTDASVYQIDVSITPDFKKPFISQEVINNSFKLSNLKFDSTYFWRVRAKDSQYYGLWSEIRSFTIQPENVLAIPNLAYPEDNVYKISVDVKILWEEVFNAKTFEIQISSTSDFKIKSKDILIDSLTEALITGLDYNTTYFWRVKAINSKAESDWSETRSFTTKLEIPVIVSPLDGDTNMPEKVKLIWNQSSGADYYHIQVATDSVFQQIVSESDNLTVNIYIPDNLTTEHKYFWRVYGLNINNESDWTKIYSFVTSKTTGIVNSPIDVDNLFVYPNPACNFLFISINTLNENTIEFFNSIGEEIFRGYNLNKIDLLNFSTGLYYYHIWSDNKLFTGNFVIVR